MFENIHFLTVTDEEIRSFAFDSLFPPSSAPDFDSMEVAQTIQSEINPARSSDYNIDGLIHILPVFPATDPVRKSYCWIQSFGWAESGPTYYTRRENATSYMILFTISGGGLLEYDGNRYELHEGDGFFIDCRKPHFYRTLEDRWEHLDLHILGPMLGPVYAEYARSRPPVFHESLTGPLMTKLEAVAHLMDYSVPARDFRMAGMLFDIATGLLSQSAPQTTGETALTDNLQYLIRYIDRHYADKMTLDFLSRFSGISKYYLSREFHRYTGFSPNEYIIRQRISGAQELLWRTNEPIATIAERVGIPNVQHFSKLFRRVTGMSPREYRNGAGGQLK